MAKSEYPNSNAMIVKTIQGLMSCVANELNKLYPLEITAVNTDKAFRLKSQAIEEIDLFEKTTLFDLQKVFE